MSAMELNQGNIKYKELLKYMQKYVNIYIYHLI